MAHAVVIGAGPNGLAAAIRLASKKWDVTVLEASATPGGGARTKELTLPGFRHDVCSAIHPLAAASPYLTTLPLEVKWVHSPAALAHPLDDGRTAVLERSLDAMSAEWKSTFKTFVARFDALATDALAPPLSFPRYPFLKARFGMKALESGVGFAKSHFDSVTDQALFAGCAAHAVADLKLPFTSAVALLLASAGHAVGWPFPQGGAQALTDAMVKHLESLGGKLRVNARVKAHAELPTHDVALFDTDAWQMARICDDALPSRYRGAIRRFRHGPAVFKIDYALDGPIPWRNAECARAATVHLGGTLAEVQHSEEEMAQGRVPQKPYVLIAQHSLFDPTRAPSGKQTVWAYCHVPYDSLVDASPFIDAQLERFAPGFLKRVIARSTKSPRDFAEYNSNYEGGDISAGAVDGVQLFARPLVHPSPYSTPNPRIFLCSASVPPGPGVHGMCGYFAAEAVLSSPKFNFAAG